MRQLDVNGTLKRNTQTKDRNIQVWESSAFVEIVLKKIFLKTYI